MKCYVNLDGFRLTASGRRKRWSTDGVLTCCCSYRPAYFIWEKDTKANDYNGYSGYIDKENVELIGRKALTLDIIRNKDGKRLRKCEMNVRNVGK